MVLNNNIWDVYLEKNPEPGACKKITNVIYVLK